jgi:hypothetical protein
VDADAGLMPVQLRFETGLTGAEYVTRRAWEQATLSCCPLHPRGGCGLARHTAYQRKTPPGTWIARWYCRLGHCTFSLLPDHLAARFPGELVTLEQTVLAVAQARSVEAAADAVRPDDITLPSAVRWIRRRLRLVSAVLVTVIGLLPERLCGCAAQLLAVGARLECNPVLPALRAVAAAHLGALPRPLGFHHRGGRGGDRRRGFQHDLGPDPPRLAP